VEVEVLSQPRTLERPRLLDVNPIDASVREALYVWLGALRGRRSRGAVAPCTRASGQSWAEGEWH